MWFCASSFRVLYSTKHINLNNPNVCVFLCVRLECVGLSFTKAKVWRLCLHFDMGCFERSVTTGETEPITTQTPINFLVFWFSQINYIPLCTIKNERHTGVVCKANWSTYHPPDDNYTKHKPPAMFEKIRENITRGTTWEMCNRAQTIINECPV